MAATPRMVAARWRATLSVSSVLALSTTVTSGAEGERFVEEHAQGGDALRQLCRLVVDRDDDLDVHGDAAGIDVGLEGSQGCHVRHGAAAGSGLREARLWIRCESGAGATTACLVRPGGWGRLAHGGERLDGPAAGW